MSQTNNTVKRCSWCTGDPLYMDYHDKTWGIPEKEGLALFAMLQLEGMQAGLNWFTILKKKQSMESAFLDFIPDKLLTMPNKDREKLITNAGIIRHKLKIDGVFKNAQAYVTHFNDPKRFSDYLWEFVDHTPIVNRRKSETDAPAQTPISENMAKSLKKLGFTFVGPTICYAFMQASGMVWDHVLGCDSWSDLK